MRISILLTFAASIIGSSAIAADSYYFRSRPAVIESSTPKASLLLSPPTIFGLTLGSETIIPAAASLGGATCRIAPDAIMPGLSVDSSTCVVSGTPTAAANTTYRILVEAVSNGKVVATSNVVSAILRAPLQVDVTPENLDVVAKGMMPTTGIAVGAIGGDVASLRWSLDDLPDWLEIVASANGNANLRLKPGSEITETARREVVIVVEDSEGRRDDSKSFFVTALPSLEKLLANDGSNGSRFGISVSISFDGSIALIGSDGQDGSGAAYVFTRSGKAWTQQAKLVPTDRTSGSKFGAMVQLSSDGSTALIGAQGVGAYVFARNGSNWSQQAKLIGSDGVAGQYGLSLFLSSNGATAFVGAPTGNSNKGAVYGFARTGSVWSQRVTITASDGLANDQFGNYLTGSSDGSVVFVGARGVKQGSVSGVGAVYAFGVSGSSWAEQAKMVPTDTSSNIGFGLSLAATEDGSMVLIGSSGDGREIRSGAAYMFTGSGSVWKQQAKLVASDGVALDNFSVGLSISREGSRALVAARNYKGIGAAYLYVRSGASWLEQGKLSPSDGVPGDWFGQSVAISGDSQTAVIGAISVRDKGANSGAAYVMSPEI